MTNRETTDLSRIIRRRRYQILSRRGWISLGLRILMLILVFWILFSRIFLIHQLEGNGMYPALKDGDLLFGFRLQKDYKNDDVVLFYQDGQLMAGRVAARAGDTVDFDEDGKFYVNGGQQAGEILYPSFPREGQQYPQQVPEGCVYVLGDYRTQTRDSRDFGPVPTEDIEGKLIGFLRRRGL